MKYRLYHYHATHAAKGNLDCVVIAAAETDTAEQVQAMANRAWQATAKRPEVVTAFAEQKLNIADITMVLKQADPELVEDENELASLSFGQMLIGGPAIIDAVFLAELEAKAANKPIDQYDRLLAAMPADAQLN